jgi:hypothetical protein
MKKSFNHGGTPPKSGGRKGKEKTKRGFNHGGTENTEKNFNYNVFLRALRASVVIIFLVSACAPLATVVPTIVPTNFPTMLPTQTASPEATLTQTVTTAPSPLPPDTPVPSASPLPSATADQRLRPAQWQEWPVIPAVSARARAIYQKGVAAGNDPRRFSKVGDCQNIVSHFLAAFDHPGEYVLGDSYASLQPVIDYFAGSWGRDSQAVRGGFNVAAVLTAFQADPKACKAAETPLACELRLFKPGLALVSMETWWAGKKAADYEKYLRQIVDYAISQNVLPILATKADNLEGDHSINLAIATVAYDYDLPLWNWWQAAQPLPSHGLQEDGFHLTHDPASPSDPLLYRRLSQPAASQFAWPMRNITALQVLDAVWKGLQ